MVIDVSIKEFAIFCAQTIAFFGIITLIGVLMYYTDDPRVKPTKLKNITYSGLVIVLFLLIFGFVQINWLP